ncbi:MAG: phosphatase PAP2 family protein [Prolixibacteraceae bacterium]|jgi:membrane-associated phospholipid phosphatase
MRPSTLINSGIFQIIKGNRYFLLPFIVLLLVSTVLVTIQGNSAIFLFVNRHYSVFADFWFLSFTKLGDGTVAFLLIFILMWVSIREAFTLLVITLLITILIALLKRFFFADYDRPLLYFGEQFIRMVPGYNPPKLHTFPSGHSATAFSVYLYLTFLVKQRGIKFGLFLVACTIGYSRVYISAHFPADVIAGSLSAVLITLPSYFYCKRIKASWIDRRITFNVNKVFTRQTA